MDTKYRKIALLDHMGFGNLGDAAIQESFIVNIKKRLPGAEIIAFSLHPADTRERHGLQCYPLQKCYPGGEDLNPRAGNGSVPGSTLKSLLKKCDIFYALVKPVHDCLRELAHLIRSYKIVRSLDLLIISGGGQLCELWGGGWSHPYNVFKFCLLARLSNTPVSIVGVGADLLEQPVSKFFAKWAVRLAKHVSFRDIESQNVIRSLAVKKHTHVCPDPAYGLDVWDYIMSDRADRLATSQSSALLRCLGPDAQRLAPIITPYGSNPWDGRAAGLTNGVAPKVGINPIGFCDPRLWPRKDSAVYFGYLDRLADFSLWLVEHGYDVEVFTAEVGVDRYAIEDLGERILAGASSSTREKVSFRAVLSLKEILLQMSTFDYVVTSKFHGVIFSHLLGKPVMALSYLSKIEHLMQAAGHGQYCLAIERCDVNWLTEKFTLLIHDKDLLASLFRNKSAAYMREVQAEFDSVLLRKLPSLDQESYRPDAGPRRQVLHMPTANRR